MRLGDGLVAMREHADVIERVSVPEHARNAAEALAEWVRERGLGAIVVEART